jgi:hypothetical protein
MQSRVLIYVGAILIAVGLCGLYFTSLFTGAQVKAMETQIQFLDTNSRANMEYRAPPPPDPATIPQAGETRVYIRPDGRYDPEYSARRSQ